jgi:membrane protein implicated in regulation of membrane protease activity
MIRPALRGSAIRSASFKSSSQSWDSLRQTLASALAFLFVRRTSSRRTKTPRSCIRSAAQLVAAILCVADAASAASLRTGISPTNIFAPASTPAHEIFRLSIFGLEVEGAIFVVVFSLLAFAVVKFRQRKDDDDVEPPQF